MDIMHRLNEHVVVITVDKCTLKKGNGCQVSQGRQEES